MITMEDVLGFPPTWAVIMMTFDVVLGYTCAFMKRDVSSSKMRDGLMHKMGYFAMLILACISEGILSYLGGVPGFEEASTLLGVFGITGVSIYIIVMELGSVMEIIGKFNPEIAKSPIFNRMASNSANQNVKE